MQFYTIESDGRYHFKIDHHLISDANTCERYFKFKHMPDAEGKVWSGRGWSSAIQVGIWWSRVMELFYREMSIEASLPHQSLMEKFAVDAWLSQNMNAQFQLNDPDYYDKFGGPQGALQMALEYYDSFAAVDFRSWTIIGSEKGFGLRNEILVGEDQDVVVHYVGKPDLVVIENSSGKLLPVDHKTKDSIPGNINEQFKPHPQTAGYIFACNELARQLGLSTKDTDRCIIRVAARLRPTDNPRKQKNGAPGIKRPRFVNVYPNYSLAELAEWQHDIMAKARRLRYTIEHDEFIPRESACHLFYHGCQFRGVCSTPPASRDLVLRSNFTKIDPWTPYNVEED